MSETTAADYDGEIRLGVCTSEDDAGAVVSASVYVSFEDVGQRVEFAAEFAEQFATQLIRSAWEVRKLRSKMAAAEEAKDRRIVIPEGGGPPS